VYGAVHKKRVPCPPRVPCERASPLEASLFHCHPEEAQAVAKRGPANEGSLHFYLGRRPRTMPSEKKLGWRLNPTGQRVVVSSMACIRWSAAAMSAKSPALLCVVKAWAIAANLLLCSHS
jgi:hypothetical protein